MKKIFLDFLQSDAKPSSQLDDKVFAVIMRDLLPSYAQLFYKFIGLQALAGMLTLAICPQFGVGLQQGHHQILHFLMGYGNALCALACAGIFMGAGAILNLILLSNIEKKVLLKNLWLSVGLPPLLFMTILSFLKNPNAMDLDMFVDPAYLLVWYLVAVCLQTLPLYFKPSSS